MQLTVRFHYNLRTRMPDVERDAQAELEPEPSGKLEFSQEGLLPPHLPEKKPPNASKAAIAPGHSSTSPRCFLKWVKTRLR
jgi:hypothetical protein